MADLTPYSYPEGTAADQLRYLKQQYAAALKAQSIRSADGREIVRQPLTALAAEIQRLEAILVGRGGIVYTVKEPRGCS
jgi:hypothetical protein